MKRMDWIKYGGFLRMPVADVANPFYNAGLRIPTRDWLLVEKYTASQHAKPDPDKSPFHRYVDLWWAGMCIGVQEHRRDLLKGDEWHRFSDGAILSSDPWRITQLQLLAVGITGDEAVLDDPSLVIQMANEYAAVGVRLLLEEMSKTTEATMAVSEYLRCRCVGSSSLDKS
jgi:hypothetical protein